MFGNRMNDTDQLEAAFARVLRDAAEREDDPAEFLRAVQSDIVDLLQTSEMTGGDPVEQMGFRATVAAVQAAVLPRLVAEFEAGGPP